MLNRIIEFIRQLRHDREALFEVRQLAFGLVIALGITYVFYFMYVETKERQHESLVREKKGLEQVLGDGSVEKLLKLQLEQKIVRQQTLQERVANLRLQKRLLREQYDIADHGHAFSEVVFTLMPRTPVTIEDAFMEMRVLEPQTHPYFTVYPVKIEGRSSFSKLMEYLRYIESRPEVGVIGELKLQQVEQEAYGGNVDVEFSLILGRISVL